MEDGSRNTTILFYRNFRKGEQKEWKGKKFKKKAMTYCFPEVKKGISFHSERTH